MSLYWRLQAIRAAGLAKTLGETVSGTWGKPWPEKLSALAKGASDFVGINEYAMGRLLRTENYQEYTGPVDAYLGALAYRDLVSGPFGSVSFYPSAEDAQIVKFQYSGANYSPVYYASATADVPALVRNSLWRGWPAARVAMAGGAVWMARLSLVQAKPPGPYVGDPSIESIVDDVARVPSPDGTRSLLILGEAGTGKSTAARRVADAIVGDGILVVPNDSLHTVMNNANSVVALRPRAVILEDVPLESSKAMLAFFETIRGHSELVISTFMADRSSIERQGQGADHWPGMRPGRIDRIVRLLIPDRRKAALILSGYGIEPSEPILDLVEGFSGAHLRELALRIAAGLDPAQEATQLRRTIEAPPEKEDGEVAAATLSTED